MRAGSVKGLKAEGSPAAGWNSVKSVDRGCRLREKGVANSGYRRIIYHSLRIIKNIHVLPTTRPLRKVVIILDCLEVSRD